MNFDQILGEAANIAEQVTRSEAEKADHDGSWVHNTMDALKSSKLTGLMVDEQFGGLGQGLSALVRVCEELGKAYSSAGLCYGMHCVGTAVIAAKATDW
ncbi:acyl-CoA dehydrogenase family protein [Dyadobacter alkalitolerans]|uniref:acyl-CoA dehydrogenase family protein n=1 Tax=Dyadobacter alkalitolerans TaxID=492736 RepID=UPI000423FA09|nr:acyl-CoA dehydrogenase family protein [Dyadobacter alkalitolerans]